MKRYLTLLLFFTVAINCYGQKIKFTDTSNSWIVNFSNKDLDVIRYNYYYLDTTIKIDTFEYRYLTAKTTYTNTSNGYENQKILVREDSSGKIYVRVYFGPNIINDSSEKLLFDYSLKISDTFITSTGIDTFAHYLSKIDTVLINNIPHRVFMMNPVKSLFKKSNSYNFIEGVGCTSNPIFSLFPDKFEKSWDVFCFSNAGTKPIFSKQIDWLNNTTSCYLSIENQKNDIKKVSIYPQPANSSFSVDLTEAISGTLRIYTTLGQIVTMQAIKHERTIHFKNQLNLHGLYYYRITTDNGSAISGKIIFN